MATVRLALWWCCLLLLLLAAAHGTGGGAGAPTRQARKGAVAPFHRPMAVAAGEGRALLVVDFYDRLVASAPCATNANARSWATDGRGWRNAAYLSKDAPSWTNATRARLGAVLRGDDACGDDAEARGGNRDPCTPAADRAYRALAGPRGVAVSDAGVYLSAAYTHTILRIDPDTGCGAVVAGASGTPGHVDGKPTKARFRAPGGIAVAENGNALYVADFLNDAVRRIAPLAGAGGPRVATVAGTPGSRGGNDGPGEHATFNGPRAVAATASAVPDAISEIFVIEDGYHVRYGDVLRAGTISSDAGKRVRRITVKRAKRDAVRASVTTLLGASSQPAWPFGAPLMSDPRGIAATPDGGQVFVADTQRGGMWRISGRVPPVWLRIRRPPAAAAPGRGSADSIRDGNAAPRGLLIAPPRTPLGGVGGQLVVADTGGSQLLHVSLRAASAAADGTTLTAEALVLGSRYVDASGTVRVTHRVAAVPRRAAVAMGLHLGFVVLSVAMAALIAWLVVLTRRRRARRHAL